MSKNVILMEFESNPNIGLFIFANDKFALVGKSVPSHQIEEIEKTLEVPVYQSTILGTDLMGVFIAGNNERIIVPEMHNYEFEKLDEICKKHEIEIIQIEEKLNTFGNALTLTDNKLIIGKEVNRNLKQMLEEAQDMPVVSMTNDEFTGAGSVLVYANNKLFASQELEEEDVKEFVDDVVGIGSINSGAGFIASGIVANKNGVIIGSKSSTVEIQQVVESLDYL